MSEPWFDPNMYSWVGGTLFGVIGGGIGGPLIGVNASKGKNKGLVFGFIYTMIAISITMLGVSIYAYASGQPYGVWYGIGLPGMIGVLIFPFLIPSVNASYKRAELKRMEMEEL